MSVLVFCAHTKVKQYNIFIRVCRFTLHGAQAAHTQTHAHTVLRSWLKLRLNSRQTLSYGKVHPKVHLQCQSKQQQADRHTHSRTHTRTHSRTHSLADCVAFTYQEGYMQPLCPETRLLLVALNHVHVMLHARQNPVETLHAQRFAAKER